MIWEVEPYEKEDGRIPVEEFHESLPPKHQAKSFHDIDRLALEIAKKYMDDYLRRMRK